MILFEQCDKATKAKIALGRNYTVDHQVGRLIKFLNRLRTICFSSNNGSLSYAPYKQVVAVKLLHKYSNNKPYDLRGFKEEVKIKYDAVKATTGKFPNVTAVIMILLAAVAPAIDWAGYCALTPDK